MIESLLHEYRFIDYVYRVFDQRPASPFFECHQVHGADIIDVNQTQNSLQEADGLVSLYSREKFPTLALAIKTADCVPLAIMGTEGYAHLHLGWRGVASNLLEHPLLEKIKPQQFYLGPSIHSCCFAVTEEFKDHFPHSRFFLPRQQKLYFSLQEELKNRIDQLFPEAIVNESHLCTCCNSGFLSYRENKTSERNWNILEPLFTNHNSYAKMGKIS